MIQTHGKISRVEMLPQPSADSLLCTLHACPKGKNATYARSFSLTLQRMGVEAHPYIGNTLASLLVGIQSMCDARRVFDKLSRPSESCWNCLIQGYIRGDEPQHAFILFRKMEEDSLCLSGSTYACLLKYCTELRDLETGCTISESVMRKGLLRTNLLLGNMLVDMYAKCGSIMKSQEVFDILPIRDVLTWTILIRAYLQHGHGNKSLHCFEQMQLEGVSPNAVTFVCSLNACSSVGALDMGKEIHAQIDRRGPLEYELLVVNALVDMYARCGCLRQALLVFHQLFMRDVCSWNSLMTGYVQHDCGKEALECLRQMQNEGICPNDVTFICSLNACSCAGEVGKGKEIHSQIMTIGYFETKFQLGNMLVDMYAKCGMLADAEAAFGSLLVKDVVTWTSLIAGYVRHGLNEEAVQSFKQMRSENIDPNPVTFACILKTCGSVRAEEKGRQIHTDLTKKGLEGDVLTGNALIDMYNKCGSLSHAEAIFNIMPAKDAVTWSTMMAGFLEHGHAKEAISLFLKMLQEGTHPNQGVLVTVLKACSDETDLHFGKLVHALILDSSFDNDTVVSNTLIHMYAICGKLEDACMVFQTMPHRNQVTWTSIISGFCHSNDVKSVSRYFLGMKRGGFKPNDVTLVCLLSAYSHDGLVEEACDLFSSMMEDPNVYLKVEHYNCVVDILGRENMLDQGKELLISMPFHLNLVGWKSLLRHCKTFGNVELGRECFDNIIALDVGNSFAYALMVDIYVDAGMWEDVNQLQVKQGEKRAPEIYP